MKSTTPSTLIAMNSFKGMLTNLEACHEVSKALTKLKTPFEIFPVGDGGYGTLNAVVNSLKGDVAEFKASDPLGNQITSHVLCLPDLHAPDTLYIESSETCGYQNTLPKNFDVMRASSLGLGQVLKQALDRWSKTLTTIYVGVGDTETFDMGMGMLGALGFRFFDAGGHVLWGNAHGLRNIRSMQLPDFSKTDKIKFVILCNVLNPLYGPTGYTQTHGKQKGASRSQINLIEQANTTFAHLIHETSGHILRDEPMTGCGGGLASAFTAFFNTELVQGARFLLNWLHFDKKLSKHDLLITGEALTDQNTLIGKAPMVCLETAKTLGKKALTVSASLGQGYKSLLKNPSVLGCFACGDKPSPQEALYEKTLEIFSDENLLKNFS